MSSLEIENLSGGMEIGGGLGGLGAGKVSERKVLQEMATQGMDVSSSSAVTGPGTETFGKVLDRSFETVNQHQVDADRAIKEMVAGRTKNPHETMLLIERADASLKLAMQVRNKILDAYREIMRMQV